MCSGITKTYDRKTVGHVFTIFCWGCVKEREVKPFAPCRRFAACKRSLSGVKCVISAKLSDNSRPQSHLSLLGALALIGTWRHLAAKVGTSKGKGKQWQTAPKNLPRNAACQSHTGRLTWLWFLPKQA
jgi:hypothetical protein